ncbi:dihydrolipoyl dehydrogenase [Anaerostipes caccae]|uniref:dihydrolipoyl dehydrogenase n=1 Tax=Anaerostipes caccae TaxID=105841 RepID=UPI00101D0814|nr:dihydrolipoyl dehydrogenase [Anaerostipes caccae]
MDILDLIVIGGGPAGYLAAQRAAESGMKVLLFEKKKLGGVCLNEGCVPTKTLLNSAKIFDHAKNGQAYGVMAHDVTMDTKTVLQRKNKVIQMLVSGVGMTMKKNKIKIVYERAEVIEKTKEGFLVEAGAERYTSKYILAAPGSETLIPPIPGVAEALESGLAITSRELLELEDLPGHLAVIGAGVIGLEMAAYCCTAGVRVTVVEMLDKVAGNMDARLSKILQTELKKKGVSFLMGHKVTEVNSHGLVCEKDGETKFAEADKILLSIGRKPVIEGCGLEHIGVAAEHGRVVTDQHLCTSVEGIYAAGDINGKMMLAHTAYRESEVAVHHMLGIEDEINYQTIPSVIYTFPEFAGIGETEESAREKGLAVKTAELPMAYSGRYVAENADGNGLCRLIMDQETGCLVGAHLLGPYVSEMIWGIAALIDQKVSVEELKKSVFPHPSVSEIIRETIFKL